MKHRMLSLVLALCLLFTVAGCTSTPNSATPTHTQSEDYRGTTERTQEVLLGTLEEIYANNGYVYFNPDLPAYYESFLSYLDIVEAAGAGITFDYETVARVSNGYSVRVLTPLDAWGGTMTLYVTMPDPEAWKYELSIVSYGKDGEQQLFGEYSQSDADTCDDVFSRVDGVGA